MIVPKTSYLEEVGIVPAPDQYQINAAALDLRIGTKLYFPESGETMKLIPGEKLRIPVGAHFLVQSLEKVTLPNNIVGIVYPRSGTNRKGITVDMTGIVDPGYSGHLMIPVSNLSNQIVTFYAGERIAQIMFERMESEVEGRQSKYHESDMAAKPDKQTELDALESGELLAEKLKEL